MKKLIFAAIAIIAFAFTACENPDELTRTELLTQKKGWVLTSATSVPAYTNSHGITDENLFKSYFDECELDDILYFTTGGSTLNFGKNTCDYNDGKDMTLGEWRFTGSEEVLVFHLPYFVDNDDFMVRLEGKINILNENTLTLRIPIADIDNDAAKSSKRGSIVVSSMDSKVDPKYQFTLTYKVAK